MDDQFLNLKLHVNNLDRFYIRKSILDSLNKNITQFDGKLLDVGCGGMPYKDHIFQHSSITEYIGIDIENALDYNSEIAPDKTWNGVNMPFEENIFNCAIATEVLEHCSDPEITIKEIYRVLKPDGLFFFTVPFLWNLHEVPNDQYRYTPFSLKRHLENSGFKDIIIDATGGWNASLAQMLGLWVKRSRLSKRKRRYFSILLKPIIKKLIESDNLKSVQFVEGQMITGLSGVAKKLK